jgi:hypothetical protein
MWNDDGGHEIDVAINLDVLLKPYKMKGVYRVGFLGAEWGYPF